MTAHDDRMRAAEYVLGLAEGTDRVEAERLIASDAGFAAEVEAWRVRLAALDDTAEPQPAGAELWQRIEAGLASPAPDTAAPMPSPPPWARWWNSLAGLRAATVGAALAALVLATGLGLALREAGPQPRLVAVLLDDGRVGAVVQAFADGRVVLLPLAEMPVEEGRALQVWTLPSRETGPVSVGLMDRARTLELQLGNLPVPGPGQLFEITLEPASGSPTGRPTGPVLFVGTTAETL